MSTAISKLIIEGETKGLKGAKKGVDDVTKSLSRANAEQDKLEKGSAGIGKNATANFAKMSQGLGGLVHVYATVAANVFAIGAAFSVLSNAADVDIMINATEKLSQATGISFKNVANSMKEVTGGAISMEEALRSASIGIASGLSSTQMEQIAEVATKAANALGRSVPEAIGRMTQAVVKNEPELVDEYGIILRIDSALTEYAASLGKTKSALTAYDKQMAIHAQLVKQGTAKFGDTEAAVNQYSRLSATFAEMAQSVLSFVNEGLLPMAKALSDNKEVLYVLSALFAKSIFNKAIPEIAGMTARLKEQRGAYKKLIAIKKEEIDLVNIGKNENNIANKGSAALKKTFIAGLKGLSTDTLQQYFGDDLGKTMGDKHAEGYKDAWKKVSIIDTLDAKGNKNNPASALVRDLSKMQDISNKFNNKGATEFVREIGKGATNTNNIVTSFKVLNSVQDRATFKEKEANTWGEKRVKNAKDLLKWLQLQTLERQKQSLLVKDARGNAFATGASSGFGLGGLKAANDSIKEGSFNVLQKSGIRIAGIFGNIAGIMGGIVSLISGWGIALFVVSQVALPIGDAMGLTSKKAREANDAFIESEKSMKKLLDTAKKIENTKVDNLQESIERTKASAANLNEQLALIIKDFDRLKDSFSEGGISKFFSFDKQTDAEENFARINKSIDEMNKKYKFNIDIIKKGAKELYVQKEIEARITKQLEVRKKRLEVLQASKSRMRSSEVERALLLTEIAVLEKKSVQNAKDIADAQSKVTKEFKAQWQILKDFEDLQTKALNAIDSIAKAQAKAKNVFAKKSPYYQQLKDLQDIQNLLNVEGKDKETTKEIRQLELDKYNLKVGTEIKTTKALDAEIAKQIESYTNLNTANMDAQLALLDVKNKVLLIDEKISTGVASNKELETKVSLLKQEKDIKIANIQADILSASIAAIDKNDSSSVEARKLAILGYYKQIANIQTTFEVASRRVLVNSDRELENIKLKASLLKAQATILADQISNATKYGSTEEVFALKRLKVEKDIAALRAEQLRLVADSAAYPKRAAKNAGEVLVINQKILSLEILKTKELSKQAQEQKQLLDRLKLAKSLLENKSATTDAKLSNNSNISNRDSTSNKDRLTLAREEAKLLSQANRLKKSSLQLEVIKAKKNKAFIESTYDGEKKVLALRESNLAISKLNIEMKDLEYQRAEELYQLELKLFDSRKAATTAATIFENPKEFTNLLSKEFDILAKNFSDSLMDPVTRTADSILRVTDTAIDTLVEAAASGENVGKAIMDAVVATVSDITKEITSDIMKQWVRDLLSQSFGIQSEQQKIAESQKIADKENTQSIVDAVTNSKNTTTSNPLLQEGQDCTCKGSLQTVSDAVDRANTDTTDILTKTEQTSKDGFGGMIDTFDKGIGSMIDSILSSSTSGAVSTDFGSSGLFGGILGGVGDLFGKSFDLFSGNMAFANGGVTGSLNRYATGAITNGPEVALIGDNNSGKEAIVPLPSGEQIPVEFIGNESAGDTVTNVTINISGTDTNNAEAVRRSAGQVALATSNALNRSQRRNG